MGFCFKLSNYIRYEFWILFISFADDSLCVVTFIFSFLIIIIIIIIFIFIPFI